MTLRTSELLPCKLTIFYLVSSKQYSLVIVRSYNQKFGLVCDYYIIQNRTDD